MKISLLDTLGFVITRLEKEIKWSNKQNFMDCVYFYTNEHLQPLKHLCNTNWDAVFWSRLENEIQIWKPKSSMNFIGVIFVNLLGCDRSYGNS